ncbi:hypothetical protein MJ1HA_1278 [Metallosphaera sedula]|nr:hypothetical protein MJ1HA_1278 [Metallosphaera sedula]
MVGNLKFIQTWGLRDFPCSGGIGVGVDGVWDGLIPRKTGTEGS